MEKVDLKKVRCQAKVAGTLVTVAGAMMMTLYKGPLMKMAWSSSHAQAHGHAAEGPVAAIDPSGREWFLGSLFVIIATLAWASLFILQAHTLKQYAAPLSLTTLSASSAPSRPSSSPSPWSTAPPSGPSAST